MVEKLVHADAGLEEALGGATFLLREDNTFTMPWDSADLVFKVHFDERYVELISHRPKETQEGPIKGPNTGPPKGGFLSRAPTHRSLAETILQVLSRADVPVIVSKLFDDDAKLEAGVSHLCEISKKIENLGDAKPVLVFRVGAKNDTHAKINFDRVMSALRDHAVDGHVVMMPSRSSDAKA